MNFVKYFSRFIVCILRSLYRIIHTNTKAIVNIVRIIFTCFTILLFRRDSYCCSPSKNRNVTADEALFFSKYRYLPRVYNNMLAWAFYYTRDPLLRACTKELSDTVWIEDGRIIIYSVLCWALRKNTETKQWNVFSVFFFFLIVIIIIIISIWSESQWVINSRDVMLKTKKK